MTRKIQLQAAQSRTKFMLSLKAQKLSVKVSWRWTSEVFAKNGILSIWTENNEMRFKEKFSRDNINWSDSHANPFNFMFKSAKFQCGENAVKF